MSNNKTVRTQVEITSEQMRCLKNNKKANGLIISWQIKEAVEFYIEHHNLRNKHTFIEKQ